ncbi:MAG TPA: cobalt ABC transporter permease [archaeon]|nr:cobalt ABC transporter permease [archaeon]
MHGIHFSARQIAFLSVMGALSFILDFFHFPISIPGSHGIYWVIPIIFGAGVVKKLGSATYIGFIAGILIGSAGLEAIGPFAFLEYLLMGFVIDLLALAFRGYMKNVIVGFVIGSAGNLSKLAAHYSLFIVLGMSKMHLILIGFGVAMISYFIFGGLGGVITSILLRGCERYLQSALTSLSGQPVKQMKK